MNTLRNSLLLVALLAAFHCPAKTTVKLSGPISAHHLSELSRVNPDMTTLDLSEARIEGDLIPSGAFAGTSLSNLTLPTDGTVTIGEGAFMGTSITELVIPSSVKAIGAGAFAACNDLKNIRIAGCEVGDYAFHLCTGLTEAEFGMSTRIGSHAFAGCTALRTFTTDGSLTSVGDFAFAHTGLIVARLADCKSLREVGAWAFANDTVLTVATFPADATLGEGVLFNCPALRHIELPANLTEIPGYAFTGTTGSDGYYTLPEGVETIGAFAYKDSDLGHIVLSPALKSIGSYAMENTERLKIIDAGNVAEVPELGSDVWAGVDKQAVQLLVPEGMTDDFRAALQWQDFRLDVSGVSDPASATTEVRAAFEGDNLIIEATGADIVRVEIFNEAGAAFVAQETHASIITIPTGNLAIRIFLVRCTLSDGSVATAKLTR